MSNKYGVFIIESLRSNDFFDGKMLKEILDLSKINAKYVSADTIDELKLRIDEFEQSEFRYLHLSCHADYSGIQLFNENVTNAELENLLKGKIENKRVFLSTCKGGNRDLASRLIKNGVYSLVGTPINLDFDKAALFWASFFHVINKFDDQSMKKIDIKYVLKSCVNLFDIPINYYSFVKNHNKSKMRRYKVRPGIRTDNRILKIY